MLNPKQQRFVDEYRVDMNATQAAIRAGYSARTARQQASDLLSKPDIQAALGEAIEREQQATHLTAERVIEELSELALNAGRPADRIKALELLGRRYALFTDNVHRSGDREVRVVWGKR